MKNNPVRQLETLGQSIWLDYIRRDLIAGAFNNWDPAKHPMKDNPDSGKFAATISVPEGRHEYKFVVNGEWHVDPNCSESVPNDCGSLNSVLTV